jgi:hypothetical protein
MDAGMSAYRCRADTMGSRFVDSLPITQRAAAYEDCRTEVSHEDVM